MISGAGFVMHQATIGDLIVAVMDAAMETVKDEAIASEIASRALVKILATVSPGVARDIVVALGDHELH